MEKHYQLDDDAFVTAFSKQELNPEWFSHEAHLRLAWIHIRKHGIKKAIDTVSHDIRQFASHHGAADKFHVTVTVAAVRAVYHFILKSESGTFQDFIQEYPQLKTKFRELLDSHYSMDIFRSELARGEFLHPDKSPFDPI